MYPEQKEKKRTIKGLSVFNDNIINNIINPLNVCITSREEYYRLLDSFASLNHLSFDLTVMLLRFSSRVVCYK